MWAIALSCSIGFIALALIIRPCINHQLFGRLLAFFDRKRGKNKNGKEDDAVVNETEKACSECGADDHGIEMHRVSVPKALMVGIFFAALALYYPAQLANSENTLLGSFVALMLSILGSMQIYAGAGDIGLIREGLSTLGESTIGIFYQVWAVILFVAAPVLSIGFVLSIFKNVFAGFKYVLSYYKDAYIFSDLNPKSFTLASDIKKKHPKAAIVFTNVTDKEDEGYAELVEEAQKLGAILFKKDILVAKLGNHSIYRNLYFFTISENQEENLNQALKLIDRYKCRENVHIYVFSTKLESELLLAANDKGKVKVRRVNEVRSLINRNLYESGVENIFQSARDNGDGTKTISAVVVGMGLHGTEMVKALAWYGQMDGYDLKITAFDKNPLAEDRFTALAPELLAKEHNGVAVEGDAKYTIAVHSGVDIDAASFAKTISAITDATYVLVALGNDDANISAAVKIRMYFERIGIKPVIQTIVYNSEQKAALDGIKNFKGQTYDIDFIGDIETSYCEDVILGSAVELEALSRHLSGGYPEDAFWNYEYNYRSSIATTIHYYARIACGIPGAGKLDSELTDEERDILEILEHKRWVAYVRGEGYIENETRNDLAKMHNNLVPYGKLKHSIKRIDSKIGTKQQTEQK